MTIFTIVKSAVIEGIDSKLVSVETDVSNGIPYFEMVGDLAHNVKEAKERVKTAIKNSGFQFPPKHIIINIAPADIKKKGTVFELPIALGILAGLGYVDNSALNDRLFVGEMSLDGKINPVNGVLAMVYDARKQGIKEVILPRKNAFEGAVIEGIKIIGVDDLRQTIDYLNGKIHIKEENLDIDSYIKNNEKIVEDFSQINGQESLKRAIEVAVAGFHNILMIGPPGAGKTMAAKRIPTIMPPLSKEEILEISKIYSIAGSLPDNSPLITKRPFRQPHHTVTKNALTGGGRRPIPGEISLAHKGVLFLDEIPEFNRDTLDILRQPLEEKRIVINRVYSSCIYPADFMMVAAANPCKCGNFPDMDKCTCTRKEILNYLKSISGPLLDRIDICVEASKVSYDEIFNLKENESSKIICERVMKALDIQKERLKACGKKYNSSLNAGEIKEFCRLGEEEMNYMKKVFETLELSVRSYHKILKTARTIADLDESKDIKKIHLSEAVCYRSIDKKYWKSQWGM
ncbi:magnesium chelatase family protein [Acetitomaculum ruminis DSM 5522]|uniref:Magnesium chelatase family protein n=1 Tax=Acetitomaculum ruminis DSM 5522 TaxID=1120918 RepID=A0A1I0ZHJ2_9FIRM|nr:YifB family Mg chelatase-like AAA ATPase [Acetitomaculum ruminis]SFB24877.1 magnesium chelatase family protein [Acetitomaculum ruminis DSM 5522]